jgi:Uma2 family endonuclease
MMVFPVSPESVSQVIGPPQGQWTFADWEALDHSSLRYEIIDGVLYVTKSPIPLHQRSVKYLLYHLGKPAEDLGIAEAFLAPIGVVMPGCDPVQPDFVLIRRENMGIVHARLIEGVPDLIAEVLSPGTADYDEGVKLEAYAKCGVPEYLVLDPQARVLRYYRLEAPGRYAPPRQFREGERVSFECAPGIAVADLFARAPPAES